MTRSAWLAAMVAAFVLGAPVPALAASADIAVALTDTPDPVREESPVNFTVTPSNNGPDNASVRVEIPIPPKYSFVFASTAQGSVSLIGDTIRFDFGAINNGNSATASFGFTASHPGAETVTAIASLPTAGDTDPNPANNVASESDEITGLGAVANPVSFGAQFLGTLSPAKTVVITNRSASAVTLEPLAPSGPDILDFLHFFDGCSDATLAVDESCSFALRFAPGALGDRGGTATFAPASGEVDPLPISLTGRGVELPTNQGPAGPPGQPILVLAASRGRLTSIRGRRVSFVYASTLNARVTLDVLRGRTRIASVRGTARRGANTIRWNGKRAGRPARPGRYLLRLTARNGGQSATARARLTIRRRSR